MSHRALIVIDIQNDYFAGGKWPLPDIDPAADNAARLLAWARRAGEPVVHIRHEAPTGQVPFFAAGSDGANIHASVLPEDGEPVVVKQHANSFRDTDLRNILDRRGITELVICGAMSNNCVDAATRAAADFGYACTVVHDACAASDLAFGGRVVPAADVHAAFMAALDFAYANAVSTDEFLDAAVKAA